MNRLSVFLAYLFIVLFAHPFQKLYTNEPISSLDTAEYRNFCMEAATDDTVFANFKLYPICRQFLENATYDLGLSYLKVIKDKYAGLLNYLEVCQSNDEIGNPNTFTYDVGEFSPTTLRYIKIAGDLLTLFSDLSGMKVIEIGGGYGGQCKILSDLTSYLEYTIVDLPEALELTKKYLDAMNVKNVRYLTPDQVQENAHYDLVISNYGFSKCSRSVQTDYLNKILKTTPYGYMTFDFPAFAFKESPYQVNEVVSAMIKNPLVNIRIYPEDPLPNPKNVIFVWRTK